MATSAKNTEQISKFGGLGPCPLKFFFFFFDNANFCKLGNLFFFVRPWEGGHGPPCPPPLELPMIDRRQDCNKEEAGGGDNREDAKMNCKSLKLLGYLMAGVVTGMMQK